MVKTTEKIKLKEISAELQGRKGAICISCGAIFEGLKSVWTPCPECKAIAPYGTRWITSMNSCKVFVHFVAPTG